MILTDYYKFVKFSGQKSKMRVDCVTSTRSYNDLERFRNRKGELKIYVGRNTYTAAGNEGKSDLSISCNEHISSIYIPNLKEPYGFGDARGTRDALLFAAKGVSFVNGGIVEGAELEVFVARGQSGNSRGLYECLLDGGLNEEMAALRQKAVAENVTEYDV